MAERSPLSRRSFLRQLVIAAGSAIAAKLASGSTPDSGPKVEQPSVPVNARFHANPRDGQITTYCYDSSGHITAVVRGGFETPVAPSPYDYFTGRPSSERS